MVKASNFSLLDSSLIFEDNFLLAINKPTGIVVNNSATIQEPTVQHWIYKKLGGEQGVKKIIAAKKQWAKLVPSDFDNKFGTPKEIFLRRQGLVHRLDKETSGVLLLAKDPGTLVNLMSQFKARKVRKKYLGLVHGKMKVDSSAVNAAIARSKANPFQFRAEIDGRAATTYYRVIDFFPGLAVSRIKDISKKNRNKIIKNINSYQQGFSLLECIPKTGRTHQIRVHLAHLNHSIVADKTYSGKKRSRLDRRWCPRQFLHAWQLQFKHPHTNNKKTIKAELPSDLATVLDYLKA